MGRQGEGKSKNWERRERGREERDRRSGVRREREWKEGENRIGVVKGD